MWKKRDIASAGRIIMDDRMCGVWRDELDLEYVMRLRIIGAEID